MTFARDRIEALKRDCAQAPRITFLLGAGASVTSGGPTTSEVDKAIEAAVAGRIYPDEEIGHAFSKLTAAQRVGAVRHLLQNVNPYLGYLSMASLALLRRVLVVTLNWDTALESAARQLGVECEAFTHNTAVTEVQRAAIASAPGLIVWHIHGTIESDVAHGLWNTVAFADDMVETLANSFLCHLTIMIGTSFTDVDLRRAFERVGRSDSSPLWALMRGEPSPDVLGDLTELMVRRQSTRNIVVDPLLDFDRVVFELAAADRGIGVLPTDLSAEPAVVFPAWDELVLPRWQMMTPLVLAPCVLAVGEPRLGKTVLTALLAQMHRVLDHRGSSLTRLEGAHRLRDFLDTLGGVPAQDERVILWCEDCLNGLADEEVLHTIGDLLNLIEAADGRVVGVLTSRLARYHVLADRLDFDLKSITDPRPGRWYDAASLTELVRRSLDHPSAVERGDHAALEIERGELSTPAAVRSFLLGAPGSKGNETESELKAETEVFLRSLRTGLRFLAVVRLGELSPGLITLADVTSLCPDPGPSESALAYRYLVDGLECTGILHPIYREVLDALIVTESGLRTSLEALPADWIAAGMDRLRLIAGVPVEQWSELLLADPGTLSKAAADLLEVKPASEILPALDLQVFDQWSILPVAYELVANWRQLRLGLAAADFARKLIGDARLMGAYALAEALMYLRRGPDRAVVNRVAVALEDLALQPARWRERALIFDAFLVGRPAHPDLEPSHILSGFYEGIDGGDRILGALAFAWLYHPASLPDRLSPLERMGGFSFQQAEEFCWMMQWHFVHQAQNRSLRNRHRITDWARLSAVGETKPRMSAASARELRSILREVGRFPELRGWAIHAAINFRHVLGAFDEGDLVASLVREVPARSIGLVTAAATHDLADDYREAVIEYFAADENRATLLNVVAEGVELNGWNVCEPLFHFVRPIDDIDGDLSLYRS